jgi:hypothetical protein
MGMSAAFSQQGGKHFWQYPLATSVLTFYRSTDGSSSYLLFWNGETWTNLGMIVFFIPIMRLFIFFYL